MTSKTPETLEATVRGQLLVAGGNGFDLNSPELEPALARQTAIIMAEFTTTLEAAKREARIDELDRKMTLHVELLSSPDFKAGFSAALDQIDAANIIRKAELSHPNQPKQDGGAE